MSLLPWVLLTFSSSLWRQSAATAIDNGIIGEPKINCGDRTIGMNFEVKNPFLGKVFIKGESDRPECATAMRTLDEQMNPIFELPFDKCGMTRLRSLSPKGLTYSATIVVSFHPLFLTKVDRAYFIRCFYGEVDKTASAALNVSMIPTTELAESSPMPSCRYSLHLDSLDGPEVQYARVGDKVLHRWECTTDSYGLLVRDCNVENGKGQKIAVVDNRGCSIDRVLLSQISYDPQRAVAFAESHVFRFADLPTIYFLCQIELCMKENCKQTVPPNCNSTPSGYQTPPTANRFRQRIQRHLEPSGPQPLLMDMGEEIYVFDIDDPIDHLIRKSGRRVTDVTSGDLGPSHCALRSAVGLSMLIVGFSLAVVMLTSTVAFLLVRSRRQKSRSDEK